MGLLTLTVMWGQTIETRIAESLRIGSLIDKDSCVCDKKQAILIE